MFQDRARSWEAYLAGFGASGTLLAAAFVIFVGLVGLVTFNGWPQAGSGLGGADDDAVLNNSAVPGPAPVQEGSLNPVRLPGGGGGGPPAATRRGGAVSVGTGGIPGSNGAPGGSGEGGTPVEAPPQPPPSPPTQPPNVVSQAVSTVGNTVEQQTDTLGDALGGSSSPGLGGVVGGVGRALNDNLQSLAGSG